MAKLFEIKLLPRKISPTSEAAGMIDSKVEKDAASSKISPKALQWAQAFKPSSDTKSGLRSDKNHGSAVVVPAIRTSTRSKRPTTPMISENDVEESTIARQTQKFSEVVGLGPPWVKLVVMTYENCCC